MKLAKVPPPVAAILSLAAGFGLHFALREPWRAEPASRACAVVMSAAALAGAAWAWLLFRLRRTPVLPGRRATCLVTSGPFRFSRNPMYLGLVVILAAIALWFGSWSLLIAPLAFFTFMSLVRIPHEEKHLREIFGEPYTDYLKKVRRWI